MDDLPALEKCFSDVKIKTVHDLISAVQQFTNAVDYNKFISLRLMKFIESHSYDMNIIIEQLESVVEICKTSEHTKINDVDVKEVYHPTEKKSNSCMCKKSNICMCKSTKYNRDINNLTILSSCSLLKIINDLLCDVSMNNVPILWTNNKRRIQLMFINVRDLRRYGCNSSEFNTTTNVTVLQSLDAYNEILYLNQDSIINRQRTRNLSVFFPPGVMTKLYTWSRLYFSQRTEKIHVTDFIVRHVFKPDGFYYSDFVNRFRHLIQVEHKSISCTYNPVLKQSNNLILHRSIPKHH